jgi:hypothetical protein
MRFKDNRGKDLGPVGDQLTVAGGAPLAGLGIGAHPVGSLARHQPRLAIAGRGPDRLKRLGDPTSDELIVASGVRTLALECTGRSQVSQASCHASSRGRSSVKRYGRSPLAGTQR